MKIIITLFFSFSFFLMASNSNEKVYSPLTSFFLRDIDNLDIEALIKKYQIYTINDNLYVGALIQTNNNYNRELLESQSYIIGADVEDILSLKIPFKKFKEFAKSNYFKYLQIDEKITFNLDQALKLSNENDILSSLLANSDYSYNNPIIGIIDFGIFYKHQMFLSPNNKNTRVVSAWVQGISSGSVKSPKRFNYGIEFNPNTNSIYSEDYKEESHGSHVIGIAAGNSFFKNDKIRGVAPNADIIAVTPIVTLDESISTGQSNILDAIKYIFEYAINIGKPAVINMSLGHHIGPHDGSGLFDQACNKLSGAGKIIVTAAGNSAEYPNTLIKDFNVNKNPIASSFNLYPNQQNEESIYLDVWNLEGFDFCIRFGNILNNKIVYSEQVCTNSNLKDYYTVSNGSTRHRFSVESTQSSFNGGKRLFIEVENIVGNGDPIIEISSGNGKVYAWNCGLGGSTSGWFTDLNRNDLVDGTNNYQIGEIGGNADSVITVGAYTSKSSLKNYFNRTINSESKSYDIAPFSSLGPSANNKVKPEITAPGNMIVSALNPGHSDFINETSSYSGLVDYGSNNFNIHYIGAMSGTSMSSPLVTGVVALMLTVNPYLGPSDIKKILQTTAINDTYTGDVKVTGSNIWGYGKINIEPAVTLAKELFAEFNTNPQFTYYPNPVLDNLNIEFQDNNLTSVYVNILDATGKIHLNNFKIDPNLPISQIPFKNLVTGSYIVELKSGAFHTSINIIKGIE